MRKKILIAFIIFPLVVFSQKKTTFSFHFNKEKMAIVLTELERHFKVKFSYIDKIVNNKQITLKIKEQTLAQILIKIEENSNLKFKKLNSRYYTITESTTITDVIQQLNIVTIEHYLTKGISKKRNSSYLIKPKKIGILAGLTEADILESIQQLPGVFSPNETATNLVVRGGSTDQNRVIWDGMNIYHNGHLFGMISAFNPNITKNVMLYNKGTNPKYGERISSVIDISTANHILKNTKASIGVNGINADAYLELPIISNKLSLQTSIRRSYTEIFESITFNKFANKVFQNTKITDAENTNNDFKFLDYNFTLNYDLNTNNKFKISTLFIDNNLDYLVRDKKNDTSFNDLLNIKNEGYSLSWSKKWTRDVNFKLLTNVSKYRFAYNFITNLDQEQISNFEKRNVIFDSGIHLNLAIKTNNTDKLRLGYQFNLKDVSYQFKQTDDFVFTLDEDKSVLRTHSFYSNYSFLKKTFFNVDLGFRINYFSGLEKIKFEPRMVINKTVLNNFTLQLTGEIKNQAINQIDETVLSDLSLETRLWRLANGTTYPLINSNQISIGMLYHKNGWSLDLDYFKKNIDGLTALSLGFINPDGSGILNGKQKVNGIDFYAKKNLNKFNAWISYSFINVKSKFNGLNNNNYFTASNEIKHAISTSFAYKHNQFQLALSWNWQKGKPYTKAILEGSEIIGFDGINTKNLANYHRLDFSTTYHFKLSKLRNLNGKIGFSIRNIYNQKNQISRIYSGNNSINDPIKFIDKFSIGFTPNLLFRIEF